MDGKEYAEWRDFYRRHPFGPVRGDYQAGVVARTLYAVNGRRHLPKLAEFVIRPERRKPPGPAVRHDPDTAALEVISVLSGIPFTPAPGA